MRRRTSLTRPAPRRRGFTMMEFTMVVFISGILAIGVGALIEIPTSVAEQQQSDEGPSRADRLLAIFDRDVRYATDVALIDTHTLQIDCHDGSKITYSWSGADTDALIRDDGTHQVELIKPATLVFEVTTKSVQRITRTPTPPTEVQVAAGSFANFTLKPGYTFSATASPTTLPTLSGWWGRGGGGISIESDGDGDTSSGGGSTGGDVDVVTAFRGSTPLHEVGIGFQADLGGPGQTADPTELQVRVRRGGAADMEVHVYEASDLQTPDESKLVATGFLRNSKMTSVSRWKAIPLAFDRKLVHGQHYLIQMRSNITLTVGGEVEWHTLTDTAAADTCSTRFSESPTLDANFYPLVPANPDAGQAPFQLIATKVTPAGVVTSVVTETVPVSARMTLGLRSGDVIKTSVPINNQVADLLTSAMSAP